MTKLDATPVVPLFSGELKDGDIRRLFFGEEDPEGTVNVAEAVMSNIQTPNPTPNKKAA